MMLPRDHNMSVDQLIAAVHKEIYSVMENFAANHDKLGNGYSAYTYILKRTSQ